MDTATDSRAGPIVGWLLGDARRIGELTAFLEALVGQLQAAGVDLARATTAVPILHPQVYSFAAFWQAGDGVRERVFMADTETMDTLAASPIAVVYETGRTVRCNPAGAKTAGEYPIVDDLRQDGFSDYVALGAPFSDGSHKVMTLATKRPGGFTDTEIGLFEAMMPAVAFHLEVQALRRVARTLLDTYVGRQTGGLVLDGAIRRGMGQTIRAAIWMSDLRGFTPLSAALPGTAVVDLLNVYFGAMCGAVEVEGGEVLKFIGDAVLAIFPIATDAESRDACRRALAAAHGARAAMSDINAERLAVGEPEIDYGIALHVGEVVYGNIGSETRLDFTVIGPAVNTVARIEGLCRDLGRRPLMSEDFVTNAGVPAERLGAFALKGIEGEQPVYAPSG